MLHLNYPRAGAVINSPDTNFLLPASRSLLSLATQQPDLAGHTQRPITFTRLHPVHKSVRLFVTLNACACVTRMKRTRNTKQISGNGLRQSAADAVVTCRLLKRYLGKLPLFYLLLCATLKGSDHFRQGKLLPWFEDYFTGILTASPAAM